MDLCSIHVGEWCKLTKASNCFQCHFLPFNLVFSSPSPSPLQGALPCSSLPGHGASLEVCGIDIIIQT